MTDKQSISAFDGACYGGDWPEEPKKLTKDESTAHLMDEAIAAGDGTLHGAIDYWQSRCARLEGELDAVRSVQDTNKVLADNYLKTTASPCPRCTELEQEISELKLKGTK